MGIDLMQLNLKGEFSRVNRRVTFLQVRQQIMYLNLHLSNFMESKFLTMVPNGGLPHSY